MTTLHGEILPYLDALGTEDGSEEMLTAMELVGTTFSIDEFTSTGVHEKYLEFRRGGVEFLVLDGVVDTVFFSLAEDEEGAASPRPDALIQGVHRGMSRRAVIERLGTPVRDEPRYLLFRAGKGYVHLKIEDEEVVALTAQRRDLMAEPAAHPAPAAQTEQPAPAPSAAAITGEISPLIAAAGTPFDDPARIEIITALGPSVDSWPLESEPGDALLLVLEDGGVDLQYRDGVLQAVLIRTTDAERSAHPRLDALVDGLTFPAVRADVTAAFGPAVTSREDLDLYIEQGRYMLFNYTEDLLTSISIVHIP